jgi:uncharacterized protein YycO
MKTSNKIGISLGFCAMLIALFLYSNDAKKKSVNTKKLATKTIFSENSSFKDGDIIFQSSQSEQCTAIQLATNSIYSHCGIIFIDEGEVFVYEAVQSVKKTKFEEWIKRGKNEYFVVKRIKNASNLLTPETMASMKKECGKHLGKNYDLTFEWSDDKIYCSELVWKIYQRSLNIEVGKTQQLKDFDLSHDIVKKKLKERYGSKIPLNETVISPGAIYDSNLLELVKSN